MIKYLLVRNWRAYEKVALEPEPGLTFVVAENGTGKTSLLQAASWSLFGEQSGSDPGETLRKGAEETSSQVVFETDSPEVTVTRRWAPDRRPRETVTVEHAHQGLSESADLPALLSRVAGLPVPVLSRLWFVPERRLVEEAGLFTDIGVHLRDLLGIASLESAATRLQEVAKTASKRASQLKQARRLDQQERRDTERRRDEATTKLADIDERLNQLRASRAAIVSELEAALAWTRYEVASVEFTSKHADLAAKARELGADADADAVVDELRETERELGRALGTTEAERELISSVSVQLPVSGGTCPVCLQAVAPSQAKLAAQAHSHRIGELDQRRVELQSNLEALRERARLVADVAKAIAQLVPPEPPDVSRDRDADSLREDLSGVDNQIEDLNRQRGELSAELRRLQELIASDEESQQIELELTSLYATEAAAHVVEVATRATAADKVAQALTPLTEAIDEQWQRFFRGKGNVAISGHGAMGVRRGESTIGYAELSGGEKVLAGLVTRLLFAASATSLDSMWLDEPLEHLDPLNRVRAARLLVEATRPGNRLAQIVVTTYEEGLARTLASRHEHVHVVYVSDHNLG